MKIVWLPILTIRHGKKILVIEEIKAGNYALEKEPEGLMVEIIGEAEK